MFITNQFESRTDEQEKAFQAFSHKIKELDKSQTVDLCDPERYVFHGTTLMAWCHIQENGFDTRRGLSDVYWGSANLALTFANNHKCDDIPVILMTQVKNLLKAGELLPDNNYDCESDTWQESFRRVGAFRIKGVDHNIQVVDIRAFQAYKDLPLHPNAFNDRNERVVPVAYSNICPLHVSQMYYGEEPVASWDSVKQIMDCEPRPVKSPSMGHP